MKRPAGAVERATALPLRRPTTSLTFAMPGFPLFTPERPRIVNPRRKSSRSAPQHVKTRPPQPQDRTQRRARRPSAMTQAFEELPLAFVAQHEPRVAQGRALRLLDAVAERFQTQRRHQALRRWRAATARLRHIEASRDPFSKGWGARVVLRVWERGLDRSAKRRWRQWRHAVHLHRQRVRHAAGLRVYVFLRRLQRERHVRRRERLKVRRRQFQEQRRLQCAAQIDNVLRYEAAVSLLYFDQADGRERVRWRAAHVVPCQCAWRVFAARRAVGLRRRRRDGARAWQRMWRHYLAKDSTKRLKAQQWAAVWSWQHAWRAHRARGERLLRLHAVLTIHGFWARVTGRAEEHARFLVEQKRIEAEKERRRLRDQRVRAIVHRVAMRLLRGGRRRIEAAPAINLAWRHYRGRCELSRLFALRKIFLFEMRRDAATTMQCMVRCWSARCERQRRQEWKEKEFMAALRLQLHCRGFLAKKRAEILRRRQRRRMAAATVIQARYRGNRGRATAYRLRVRRDWRQHCAATVVERYARRRLARNELRRRRVFEQYRHRCATLIKRRYRVYLAQAFTLPVLRGLRDEGLMPLLPGDCTFEFAGVVLLQDRLLAAIEGRHARAAGALALQRLWRGHCGRRIAQRRRAELAAQAELRAASTALLQRVVRGHWGRQRFAAVGAARAETEANAQYWTDDAAQRSYAVLARQVEVAANRDVGDREARRQAALAAEATRKAVEEAHAEEERKKAARIEKKKRDAKLRAARQRERRGRMYVERVLDDHLRRSVVAMERLEDPAVDAVIRNRHGEQADADDAGDDDDDDDDDNDKGAKYEYPWVAEKDPTSRQMYYTNTATGEQSWELPPPEPDGCDWKELEEATSGRKYYQHKLTQELAWDPPPNWGKERLPPERSREEQLEELHSMADSKKECDKCGARATKLCLQCQLLYCTACFALNHRVGERRGHRSEPVKLKDLTLDEDPGAPILRRCDCGADADTECKDCPQLENYFCAHCYKSKHAEVQFTRHKCQLFVPGTRLCSECRDSFNTVDCKTCGDVFCGECFDELHNPRHGQTKHDFKRLRGALRDPLPFGKVYCRICRTRAAERRCNVCVAKRADLCLDCFEDAHSDESTYANHTFVSLDDIELGSPWIEVIPKGAATAVYFNTDTSEVRPDKPLELMVGAELHEELMRRKVAEHADERRAEQVQLQTEIRQMHDESRAIDNWSKELDRQKGSHKKEREGRMLRVRHQEGGSSSAAAASASSSDKARRGSVIERQRKAAQQLEKQLLTRERRADIERRKRDLNSDAYTEDILGQLREGAQQHTERMNENKRLPSRKHSLSEQLKRVVLHKYGSQ